MSYTFFPFNVDSLQVPVETTLVTVRDVLLKSADVGLEEPLHRVCSNAADFVVGLFQGFPEVGISGCRH